MLFHFYFFIFFSKPISRKDFDQSLLSTLRSRIKSVTMIPCRKNYPPHGISEIETCPEKNYPLHSICIHKSNWPLKTKCCNEEFFVDVSSLSHVQPEGSPSTCHWWCFNNPNLNMTLISNIVTFDQCLSIRWWARPSRSSSKRCHNSSCSCL